MGNQRVLLLLLLLSTFSSLCVFGETSGEDRADFPCPFAEDIAPCICSIDEDHNIDLDCTNIESDAQLANVFQQDFPIKQLQGFYMTENLALRALGNVLNGVSFERIDIHPGPFELAVISDYFLLDCKDTLSFFRLDGSNLISGGFPFSTLDEMEDLEMLTIMGNNFTWIPKLYGPKITDLRFIDGRTETIEPGTFDELLSLRLLGLYHNAIAELVPSTFIIREGPIEIFLRDNLIHTVQPGTFIFDSVAASLSNEEIVIDLHYNSLQSLQARTFFFRDGPMIVYLYGNQLASIEPGTFVLPPTTENFSLTLWLNSNQLETFEEDVFRELLPFTTSLIMFDNPLHCGCDIAWLVTNATYLEKMDDRTTCQDGTAVLDLTPDYYLQYC